MTSNVGTEYINLKAAKYNRDMTAQAQRTVQSAAPVYKETKAVTGTLTKDVYGAGEIFGDILSEVGRILAKKRREAARRKANEAHYVKKSVRAQKPLPISLIGYIIVFSAIALFLVMGNTQINEYTLRADALNREISAAKEQGEILSSQLNARKDVSYIDEYATKVLGMVKSTDVAKRYVSISGEDKIVTNGTSSESGVHTNAAVLLDSVR